MRSFDSGVRSGKNQDQTWWIKNGLKTYISRKHRNYTENHVPLKCRIFEEKFTISYSIKQKAGKSISVKSILNPDLLTMSHVEMLKSQI